MQTELGESWSDSGWTLKVWHWGKSVTLRFRHAHVNGVVTEVENTGEDISLGS